MADNPLTTKTQEQYEQVSDVSAQSREQLPLEHEAAIYRRFDKLRREILPNGKKVMKEHRFEVFAAMAQMLSLIHMAMVDGANAICREGKRLQSSDSVSDRFLAAGMEEKAMVENSSIDIMLQQYDNVKREQTQDYIFYIYMRGMELILSGTYPAVSRLLLISLLSPEERDLFETYEERKN